MDLDQVLTALSRKEITQTELSARSGISQASISYAMNRKKRILHDNALKLISAYSAFVAERAREEKRLAALAKRRKAAKKARKTQARRAA